MYCKIVATISVLQSPYYIHCDILFLLCFPYLFYQMLLDIIMLKLVPADWVCVYTMRWSPIYNRETSSHSLSYLGATQSSQQTYSACFLTMVGNPCRHERNMQSHAHAQTGSSRPTGQNPEPSCYEALLTNSTNHCTTTSCQISAFIILLCSSSATQLLQPDSCSLGPKLTLIYKLKD